YRAAPGGDRGLRGGHDSARRAARPGGHVLVGRGRVGSQSLRRPAATRGRCVKLPVRVVWWIALFALSCSTDTSSTETTRGQQPTDPDLIATVGDDTITTLAVAGVSRAQGIRPRAAL